MFEHKHLDGTWNRVIPATDSFLAGDVLECRDNLGGDVETAARRQYAVVGDRLVERCLPAEKVGDVWSYDAAGLPWWGWVKNPPHMGIVAEFNEQCGGLHRKPFAVDNNIVAYGESGEEVHFADSRYKVARASDSEELTADSLVALREQYYA